ncbi:MAG: type VI secretion system baseplate subunit TssF [Thalassobaculales bacterium]
MVDDLLPYYNQELLAIRRLAAEFAQANPKIAGRLRLSADAVEDPHVARLIEAFAFLNARTRLKLDDEFPELTDGLLGLLYPHYLAPIPSMAIVRMTVPPDLSGAYSVPAGTLIESEPVAGEVCTFRTGYEATLWPVVLEQAALGGRPLTAPANPRAGGAVACLRLVLRCENPEMTFTQLGVDRLRLALRGAPQQVHALHELVFNHTLSVALADGPADPAPVILGPESIGEVGYAEDEGLLPRQARSFPGYLLLTEFFAFPEKFLFFDLLNLSAKTLVQAGNRLEVFIYLNRAMPELERTVSAENFALGCTPVINLFAQRCEPVALTETVAEYHLVPDARRPQALEITAVERVALAGPDGSEHEVAPFFALKHATPEDAPPLYWHATRRPAGGRDAGTELFLSFADINFDPRQPADWVAVAEATCCNRDLPGRLPFGGGHPYLRLVEGGAVKSVQCLTPPTPTLRPAAGRGGRWRLISHLSLNHLSLTGGPEGTEALREILRLYDFRDSAETRAVIDGIAAVEAARGVARAPVQDEVAFCRGTDIAVTFDDTRFSGGGMYLFAAVLERFLSLHGAINSFTRMTARVKGRPGIYRKWPPRAGQRPLL